MELTLKIFDGLDVQTSILDSAKSNVFIDGSSFIVVKLFDSSGNCILSITNPL